MSPLDRSIMAKTLTAAVNVRAGARGANDRLRVTCKDAMTSASIPRLHHLSLSAEFSFRALKAGPHLLPSAINTALTQDLIFYGQPANSGETIALEGYRAELLCQA